MNKKETALLSILFLLVIGIVSFTTKKISIGDQILSYTADPKAQDIQFYWKDDNGKIMKSIHNLKTYVTNKQYTLVFAMNGGMYMPDFSPVGLFIQDGKILKKINKETGKGNFFLKPNGVFYITKDNHPVICKTESFKNNGNVRYATQSGPMLVIDGEIHPSFKAGSSSLNVRNGVGILPDNRIVFAISKTKMNLYDFAKYFKEKGCINALYLDGFVSRMYLPEKKWTQTDGNFGVMIGITIPKD